MGRYTQRRRAASTPSPGATLPVATVTITAVFDNFDGTFQVTFSGGITYTPGPIGTTFQLNGSPPTAIAQTGFSQLQVDSASAASGDPWTLSGPPPWLSPTCTGPASGLIA